jgi:hypothetical protein
MPKPDALEYDPAQIDNERESGSTFMQRRMYDVESLDELLKIVNTKRVTESA